MEQAATQTQIAPAGDAWFPRGRMVTFALALLLLFAAPGPMLVAALFVASVTVLATLPIYIWRRERLARHLRKAVFRGAFLVLAFVLTAANFSLAEARLERVVDAIHAYHADHGAYPADLADLAPGYIDEIPRATLWLTMNRFHWNGTMLTCIPDPPVGWIGHDFRTDTPAALD